MHPFAGEQVARACDLLCWVGNADSFQLSCGILQLSAVQMASDAGPGPSGRPDRVEGMGWLTESSVQPRKRRAIEGAGFLLDTLS